MSVVDLFFFSSRRRHTRFSRDWSSDVCSSDLLNARKLGLTLVSFIQISMDKHTPERLDAFEKTVGSYPEVLECHLITGQSADYLLKVIVKDMDAYQQFLLQKLTRIEGVSGVHSSFVLKSPVAKTALPVG